MSPSTAPVTSNGSTTAGYANTAALERPTPPFVLAGSSGLSSGTASPTPVQTPNPEHKLMTESSSVSLSVNYLPTKFSSTMLNAGARRRKNGAGKKGEQAPMTKIGGGVEAFRSGEARMPGEGDEDYDGVNLKEGWFGTKNGRRMSWNRFKWTLFFANICVKDFTFPWVLVIY